MTGNAPAPPVSTAERSLWRAYEAWCAGAGALAAFVLPTPFLGTELDSLEGQTALALHPFAGALSRALRQRATRTPGVAMVLDAAPRLGLSVAMRLSAKGWAAVPMYGRWPVPGAVLPTEHLTRWLAAGASVSSRQNGPACLLLDSERARRVSPTSLRTRFDNRYEHGPHQFPPAARWRSLGVRTVLLAGLRATPASDIESYVAALVSGGIIVDLVSVATLLVEGRGGPPAEAKE